MPRPWFSPLLVLLLATVARADVPDPAMSSVTTSSPPQPQFHFNFAGTLDVMTVTVEARDASDDPCPFLPVTILLSTTGVPGLLWECCPVPVHNTDALGIAEFTYSKLGGGGTLQIQAIAGSVFLDPVTVPFTTPDPDGSAPPLSLPDIADFMAALTAYLATGIAPMWADYNGDAKIDVIDLAFFAGQLFETNDCAASPCP